jgi:hypothetical protein
VRKIADKDAHALLGNYQKLGHLENGEFEVLRPQRGMTTYSITLATGAQTPVAPSAYAQNEAISYYQTASYLYSHGLYRALTAEEFQQYTTLGRKTPAVTETLPAGTPVAPSGSLNTR